MRSKGMAMLGFECSPIIKKEVQELAKVRGCNESEVLRSILSAYFSYHKKEVN